MFDCWWCEERFHEDEKVTRSYPGVSNENFCHNCAIELDARSDDDWEDHYDRMDESIQAEATFSEYDYGYAKKYNSTFKSNKFFKGS